MTDKIQPTAHAEITAPISADLRRIAQEAREHSEPSPTAGMNLGRRILHVGGRENAAGYIEFGSVAAVRALVGQVLRDLQAAPPAPAGVAVPVERQAFEHYQCDRMRRDLQELTMHPDGRYDCDDIQAEWEVWQARAAVAAAPAQAQGITIDFKQATVLLEMFGGEPTEITLMVGDGHSGNGLYASYSDMPEEGAEFLGIPDDEAMPAAPAQEHATQLAGQGLECGVCGSDEAFTGTCGGGRTNPSALCFVAAAPAQAQEDARDAARYRWLRERDLDATHQGGVFAGKTPDNVVLNGEDLDAAIDAARAAQGDRNV